MNLPDVKIVDMNYAIRNSIGHFSKDLIDEINDRLSKKEQVILLLNRRGYDTVVSCKNCGYTYKCPNCDITLTYHKSSNNLRCHYCGYAAKLDINCPKCHERSLNGIGTGTEKIEEELNKLFKQAKVLRMDFDTTTKKGSHEKLIESFKKKEYDILIGTQIVAKGLDFDDVTLVGIINADTSLNIPNYRSSEETFELLSQTAGRSGRKKHGTVILQTYNKDHYAIRYTKSHDYLNFFKEEMNIRREMKYPPYYYLIYIKISGKDNNYVYKEALKIYNRLLINSENDSIYLIKSRLYFERAQVYSKLGMEKLSEEDMAKAEELNLEPYFQNPIPAPTLLLDNLK
jgi:primosomal protein N' (replication factor Y)